MIGKRYSQQRTAVIDLVRRYQCNRGRTEDGVDSAFLSERAAALENGRYVLAVVGEAKAGKSTLINALLGERILPTDVLQSSSAVVEIFKSDEKFLEVQYADGHSEKIRDDLSTQDTDEAFDYLRKIGALQDHFRKIPTALIDSFIIKGRVSPGDELPIEELQTLSRLPLKGREDLVAEYVNGQASTNGVESFWAALKRGYHGVYHHMSPKHLDRYVTDCHFRPVFQCFDASRARKSSTSANRRP